MTPLPQYVIWSEHHGAWWAHERTGYTRYLTNAGRYSKAEAQEIVTEANQYSKTWNELAIPDPLNPNLLATEEQRFAALRELLPNAQGNTVDELLESQAKLMANAQLQSQQSKPFTASASTPVSLPPPGATTQQVPPGD